VTAYRPPAKRRGDAIGAVAAAPESAPSMTAPLRRWPLALLAVLAAAGLARLYGLDREGLWNDEVLSIVMSRGTLVEVLAAVLRDVHPPLHFVLCWLWQPIAGESAWLWRLPSALCGLAAVGLVWRISARLVSRRAAPVASIVAATSTMAIYYAQEARSYALLLLLTLVALDRALTWEASRRNRDAVLLSLAASLLLYTHYFGALVLLVFVAWMLLRLARAPDALGAPAKSPDWRGLAQFGLTQAVALLTFVPWLWAVRQQIGQAEDDFWLPRPEPHWLPFTLAIFGGLARPVWGGSRLTLGELGLGLAVTLPLVAVLGSGLLRQVAWGPKNEAGASRESKPTRAAIWFLLFAWLLAPAVIAYAVSQGPVPIYSHRNLIVSLPAWWLLAAALIDRIPRPTGRALALAVVLAPAVSGGLWYYGTPHKEQWRELAAEVATSLQPSDHVSVEDAWLVEVFRFHLGDRPYRPLLELNPSTLLGVRKLWLIRGPSSRPDHLARVNRELAALQMAGFRVTSMKRFIGAELIVLEPPLRPTREAVER
jgi:mannosyltransferase